MDAPPAFNADEINQSKVHQVVDNFLDDDEQGEFDFLSSLQSKKEARSSTHILKQDYGKVDDFEFPPKTNKLAHSEIESARQP